MRKKVWFLVFAITLTIIIGTLSIYSNSPAAGIEPTGIPVDINSVAMREAQVLLPSKIIYKLTYPKMFEEADLVAVVEVTPEVVTYLKPWPHTLYKSRVIQFIKGSTPDIAYIVQTGGYDPEHRVFLHLESDPILRPGERWLFFLKSTLAPLAHKGAFVANFICLKLEDGKLYSLDIYNELWKWTFLHEREMDEGARAKLGIQGLPPLYDRLHVEGLTVEEFIKQYLPQK